MARKIYHGSLCGELTGILETSDVRVPTKQEELGAWSLELRA